MTMQAVPPGAIYIPDFISADDQKEVVGLLDGGTWSSELKRRVQHFGYRYDYRARAITAEAFLGRLPGWLQVFCERLKSEAIFPEAPDQVIANEYLSGQGISAHVDCVPCFSDHIASLSLLSHCEMIFKYRATGGEMAVLLQPRSLLLLAGSGRYDWTHEIPARKSDIIAGERRARERRVSLTFRKVIAAN